MQHYHGVIVRAYAYDAIIIRRGHYRRSELEASYICAYVSEAHSRSPVLS